MKQLIKQLGKGFCYVLLFWGMQQIVGTIIGFWYGFREGMRAAAAGTVVDAEKLTLGITEYMAENTTWLVSVSGLLTLLFLWIFFKVRRKKLSQECSLKRFETGKALPVLLLGISSAFVIYVLLQMLPIPESLMESYAQSSSSLMSGFILVNIFADVIVAPVTEEIIFRGLILSRLCRAMPVWTAVGISSLLFALMHGNLLWMAYTFAFGCLLAVVAVQLESIGASLVLHMAFNLTGVFMGFLPLTEVTFYLLGGLAFLVMFATLALIFRRKTDDMAVKEI